MMSKRAFASAWTEGVYLDPGRRDVVQHFLDVVRELVERYPVDGIHLDYARYPVMDVGYNEAMRAGSPADAPASIRWSSRRTRPA